MAAFDFSALRRFPDVEAPNLQAWDATDELLVRWALDSGVAGDEIAVIGDEYGAITLALRDAGMHGIQVHQDLVTGRRALALNALRVAAASENADETRAARRVGAEHADADAEHPESSTFTSHELDESLLAGARLVLLQLPKALAELEEIADAVARWASPEVVLVAGGRVKHMTLAQNEVLARSFGVVQPQRAERKSRLILVSDPLPVPSHPPFPVRAQHDGLTLCAFGGVFAGARLDIGTRVLRDALPQLALASDERQAQRPGPGEALSVVDLGCGTGALAAAFALQHPDAVVTATDRSAAAIRSARATMAANGLDGRVRVTLDDAGSELPDASADLVLLNPPFHLGASVHEGAGRRLIQAAARLLRPGGEVWTVFNSHLDHRRALSRDVGPTEQVARTSKFTVTRSIRRG
ncbi:methyltransferase [Microbacterium sp. ARD32]|uniref:class I SAM-dependent methyltransferase n=1 Tax=Microbacterium sp. ARD32 TaxID=2962577 RepID=UPI002881E4F0|nr:methyltransferase [Microbacterium sp. ARD32]MDT0157685.1 methyltransferase [Microbacterium sp. ARD32]